MKFRLQAVAAAILAAASGIASAAITVGPSGDGELFLMAYDTTSQTTYSFDTGILSSAFSSTSNSLQSFTLTGFSSFLAGATASTIRWGVYAVDAVAPTALFTTAAAGASAVNPNLQKYNNSNGALTSFGNAANFLGTHATQANGWALQSNAPTSGIDFTYGGNIVGVNGNFSSNLSFNTTGALGDSLSFFKFSSGNPAGSVRTVYADVWKLDAATGSLTYGTTAPVPEPGTYALMLAGLLTLGAVARRRAK